METIRISRINTSSSASISRSSSNSRSSGLPSVRTYINGPGPGKYARNSSIGYKNTDFTLRKSPAFSIGRANRWLGYGYPISPGPIYCPKMVKKSVPGFFICNRSNDFGRCVTPGPGAYAPEKHSNPFKSSVPAFSIGRAQRFPTCLA